MLNIYRCSQSWIFYKLSFFNYVQQIARVVDYLYESYEGEATEDADAAE